MCTRLDAGKKYGAVGLGWSRRAMQRGQKVGEICLISGVKEALGVGGWLSQMSYNT